MGARFANDLPAGVHPVEHWCAEPQFFRGTTGLLTCRTLLEVDRKFSRDTYSPARARPPTCIRIGDLDRPLLTSPGVRLTLPGRLIGLYCILQYSRRVAAKQVLQIRLTDDEKAGFVAAAGLAGIPLSAWVRERLRQAAIRDLVTSGQRPPFVAPLPPTDG